MHKVPGKARQAPRKSVKAAKALPRRRTQAERSESTRRLLLDATLDCLVERGYGGTTTTLVADRAGVSRGAQLHHVPAKAELVTAAVEHLFARRHQEYLAAMAELPPGKDEALESIDQIWGTLSGPTFYAFLEVLVAARTDAALRRKVAAITEKFASVIEESFRRQFGHAQGGPFFETAPAFTFALLQGLGLERILDTAGSRKRIASVLEAFKLLSQLIVPRQEEHEGRAGRVR
jgi:AcrR family transcriptional regulator